MRKLKLIWDFKGEDGFETAKHHCVHLKEFANIENLPFYEVNFTQLHPLHTIAFIIINEKEMIAFRDALKPHRGEIAS